VKYLLLLLLPSLVYSQSTVQSFKKVKSDTLASVTATGQIVFADSNVYLLLPSGARHKLDSTGAGGAAGSGVLDSIRAGFGIDTVLIGDSVITVLVDSTVIATLYDISLKLNSADTTTIRNYSNALYLKNADSTTQRTYSNSLYLKNADSTSVRNYSTSLYLPKISPTSSGTMSHNEAAATNILNMTATDKNLNVSTAAQARDTSAFNFRFTGTGKPLVDIKNQLGANVLSVDSLGRFIVQGSVGNIAATPDSADWVMVFKKFVL